VFTKATVPFCYVQWAHFAIMSPYVALCTKYSFTRVSSVARLGLVGRLQAPWIYTLCPWGNKRANIHQLQVFTHTKKVMLLAYTHWISPQGLYEPCLVGLWSTTMAQCLWRDSVGLELSTRQQDAMGAGLGVM